MRLLIDTNIFLEILLEQSRSEEAKELLRKVDQHDFFISDFALHSVGLLLLRQSKPEVFRTFLSDMISNAGIIQLGLSPLLPVVHGYGFGRGRYNVPEVFH